MEGEPGQDGRALPRVGDRPRRDHGWLAGGRSLPDAGLRSVAAATRRSTGCSTRSRLPAAFLRRGLVRPTRRRATRTAPPVASQAELAQPRDRPSSSRPATKSRPRGRRRAVRLPPFFEARVLDRRRRALSRDLLQARLLEQLGESPSRAPARCDSSSTSGSSSRTASQYVFSRYLPAAVVPHGRCDDASRACDARHLAQASHRIGHEVDDELREHELELAVGERQLLGGRRARRLQGGARGPRRRTSPDGSTADTASAPGRRPARPSARPARSRRPARAARSRRRRGRRTAARAASSTAP